MAFHRGSEGRHRTDIELARQKERAEQRKKQGNMPFRFYVPIGETRQIIICDDAPDFFMYEHNLPGPDKKYRTFTGCIKEDANCPVCEASDKESYYAMFLTVIDLTPFETRAGEEVEFSRKLLVVKPGQQKKFLRFYEKNKTLRGALFEMTRDGEKDASIGNDIEFVEFVPEEEMETYTRSWKDKDGKKHHENCSEVYDYEALFEEPTEESLRAIVGGRPSPGSKEADDRELGRRGSRSARGRDKGKAKDEDGDWEDDDDQREYKDEKKPARGRTSVRDEEPASKRASARRGRAEPDDADGAEAEPEAKPARRGRDDSQRVTRKSRVEEPEDVDEDDAEPEEKPARTTRARQAEDKPRRGRAAPEDDDPPFEPDRPARGRKAAAEPEDEDEAPRTSRRTSMRGRR
jgi:hypothetical protein